MRLERKAVRAERRAVAGRQLVKPRKNVSLVWLINPYSRKSGTSRSFAGRGVCSALNPLSSLANEKRRPYAVIERPDPEAVTGAEQLASLAVPQREGPHTVESADARFSPPLVCGEDGSVSVSVRKEKSVRFELTSQFEIVVDLTVANQPVAADAISHRLAAVR